MMNASRRIYLFGAVLSVLVLTSSAVSQSAPATTALGRQFERIDLGINGIGVFNKNTSGTSLTPQNIAQVPSNTGGLLIELRYTKSPLVGFQLNFTQARYTENYTVTDNANTPKGQLNYVLGVQTKVNEFSLGYVAHGPQFFGVRTFAGAGLGGLDFHPTAGGGQGLQPQARTGVYYSIGADAPLFGDHFGLRLQFRQLFFGTADFNENYLATGARTTTTEPGIGFYLRF